MEIEDDARRALEFLRALGVEGHAPTIEELEAYVLQPGRKRGGAIPKALLDQADQLKSAWSSVLGVMVPYKGESVAGHLERVRWAEVRDGRIRATALGDAVLRATEASLAAPELPVALILGRDDKLAYARVIGAMAGMNARVLIDPYLNLEGLGDVLKHTTVDRILVGQQKERKAELAVAVRRLGANREVEIRASSAFHDRFVFGDDGHVHVMGTSLNGVGVRLSVMVRLEEAEVVGAVKSAFESAWTNGEVVHAAGT